MNPIIQATQTAESIPFTPSSGITATNVEQAIIQASTMGPGGGGGSGFSYKRITTSVTIPTDMEMIVYQSLKIDGGELILNGELAIIL